MKTKTLGFALSISVCVLAACSAKDGAVGTAAGALHGVSTPDTAFPAIVAVGNTFTYGGCSGTLVAPHTVLTASHCISPLAQNCARRYQDLATQPGTGVVYNCDVNSSSTCKNATIAFTANGSTDPANAVLFEIDGFEVLPGAYSDFSSCSSTSMNYCGTGVGGSWESDTSGLINMRDIALVHTRQAIQDVFPSVNLLPVLTDITTNDPSAGAPFAVHASLNLAQDITPSTQAWIGGLGQDDFPLGYGTRFRGQALYGNPYNGDPWLNTVSQSYVNCANSPVSTVWATELHYARTTVGGVQGAGPQTDSGDSGSPVTMVADTLANGGIPELLSVGLPSGEHVVNGVVHGGDSCPQNGGPIPPSTSCEMVYAPTFLNGIGGWLDQRLVDFDGDGISDWEDHCPTVPDSSNADSNQDAEYTLGVANGTWTYPYPTNPPTKNDWLTNRAYVEAWQKTFPGDACDGSAVSASTATFSFNNDETTPCDQFQVYQSGNARYVTRTTGTGCKRLLHSGLSTRAAVGGEWGDAPSNAGTALPGWCNCVGTPIFCSNPQQGNCPIADDDAKPVGGTQLGWLGMTQRIASAESAYAPFSTTHVDPSKFNPNRLLKNAV